MEQNIVNTCIFNHCEFVLVSSSSMMVAPSELSFFCSCSLITAVKVVDTVAAAANIDNNMSMGILTEYMSYDHSAFCVQYYHDNIV